MGIDDKARNEAEEKVGQVKEFVGDKTDNPELEGEGRAEQVDSRVKQAGEHVKDAIDDVKRAVHD
jgi:uncharacterized protein YjbJ (UPF0337 family)